MEACLICPPEWWWNYSPSQFQVQGGSLLSSRKFCPDHHSTRFNRYFCFRRLGFIHANLSGVLSSSPSGRAKIGKCDGSSRGATTQCWSTLEQGTLPPNARGACLGRPTHSQSLLAQCTSTCVFICGFKASCVCSPVGIWDGISPCGINKVYLLPPLLITSDIFIDIWHLI